MNVLAGASRYRLLEFLAFAFVGRLIWTSAYLGLGYAVGGDVGAATGFLTNLTGLLVSSGILVALGLATFRASGSEGPAVSPPRGP